MNEIFYKLCQNFIKKSELKFNCSIRSPQITLPIKDIYVGSDCEELLKKFPEDNVLQIKSDCLKLYTIVLEETQQRLLYLIFKAMPFLNPEKALGGCNKSVFQFKLLCQ